MSRRVGKRVTERRLAVERQEIGFRMGKLLERYHVLHTLPLEMRLHWLEKPVLWRAVLRLLGRKPNVAKVVNAKMQELDDEIVGPCMAKDPHGAVCELSEGHEGPHKRAVGLSLKGGKQYIGWEDEEDEEDAA